MSSDKQVSVDGSANKLQEGPATPEHKQGPKENRFEFDPWVITTRKSHILQSKCTNSDECSNGRGQGSADTKRNVCSFCRYEQDLTLAKLPDMVFAENSIRIEHKDHKLGLEFHALDALKLVDATQDGIIKVAVANAWREARADSEYVNDVVKPFDWTFTTKYKGSLFSSHNKHLEVTKTTQRIDVEKLKEKEKILFYDDLPLFEDELADNGCAFLSVKIRVMPSGFFLLQRFYLRVDNVIVRVYDTRLHHQTGTDYMLREFSVRESRTSDLERLPSSILTDPNEVWVHLQLKEEEIEKLEILL